MTEAQRKQFFEIRKALDRFVMKIADNPGEINTNMAILCQWKPGVHVAGDACVFNGIPRYCKQSHDSTNNPEWTPDAEKALWGIYHGTTPETAREFEADSANVYKVGEYAMENGKVYLNNYDGNVYAPSVLPERWMLVE